MPHSPSSERKIEEVKELVKQITFYARVFVENPNSPASPQSNLEGLLRNRYTREELDEKAIRLILSTIILKGKGDKEGLTEDYILRLIHRHLSATTSNEPDL